MRLSGFAAASCAAFSLFVPAMARSQTVGQIQDVAVYAYATKPGAIRTVAYARDVLVANERLETVPTGALLARFADGTQLTLGGGAEIVIDRAVYDPAQPGTGQLAVTFAKGAFRYVSGAIPRERIDLRMPNAQIGIRGTDVTAVVNAGGTTTVHVRSGAATIASSAAGAPVQVGARQSVTIAANGNVGTPVDFPSFFFGQTGDPLVDQTLTGSSGVASSQDSVGSADRVSGEGGSSGGGNAGPGT